MRLIELGSDKSSFRTINFKPNGLSIIVGTHIEGDSKSTYNGVGKTFALYLIQFCLGASSNDKLVQNLPDWTFYLKFEIENEVYTSSRNTSNQRRIFLNNDEYGLSEFNLLMKNLVFDIDEEIHKASFRSLISRFLRIRKEEYAKFDRYVYKEQDDRAMLSNSILMGLNYSLVQKKFLLREEYNKVNSLRTAISKDEIFVSIYGEEVNIDQRLEDLEELMLKLESSIADFEIAEDYKELENATNGLSYRLKVLSNELALLRETQSNISKSLEVKSDMKVDDVLNLVNEIEKQLGLDLKGRINEALEFHDKLLNGRRVRLLSHGEKLAKDIKIKNLELQELTKEYNLNLKYLNSVGALEDYVSLSMKLMDTKSNYDKLLSSVELLNKYKEREQEIKITLAEDNLNTQRYLIDVRDTALAEIKKIYKELTEEFYKDRSGRVSVENNEGENKLRYKINAKIPDDSSDGINEVGIFCFDLMLLKLQKNHNVKFIFHDSRLLSNMDSHQRFVALKLGHELKADGKQYIISLNQDTIDLLQAERSDVEFQEIVKDNIIIELSGDVPSNKLLGVQVDLDYVKK